MRNGLADILARTGARLRRARAAEGAAVVAAGAALPAAAAELAWALAGVWPEAAWALAAPGLVVAAGVLPVGVRRALSLRPGLAWAIAAAGVAAAVLAAAGAWLAPAADAPPGAVAGGVLLVAALVGAAVGGLRRVSAWDAAVWLDQRGHLRERVATAVELTERANGEPGAAAYARAQAEAALRTRRPHDQPPWRRTRRTAAALALGVLACAAAALVPHGSARGPADVTAANLDRLSPAELARLADALERAARWAAEDPAQARRLLRAAEAAQQRRAVDLERLLAELEARGLDLAALLPAELRRELARRSASPGGGGEGSDQGPDAYAVRGGDGGARPGEDAAEPWVVRPQPAGTADGAAAGTPPERNAQRVPFADAWSAAKAREADALARGEVPVEYRPIVRAFFADEP